MDKNLYFKYVGDCHEIYSILNRCNEVVISKKDIAMINKDGHDMNLLQDYQKILDNCPLSFKCEEGDIFKFNGNYKVSDINLGDWKGLCIIKKC